MVVTQFDLFHSAENSVLDAEDYPSFRKALSESQCAKCALSAGRTHIVVDRGNPNAKMLLIGEAPGENEDLQGKPFVGRAGKLLDELMKGAGFDTNVDMLIANVAKCRPPDNRAPKQEEADACMPYLQKQIDLMKPKLMILLGATSVKHMAPELAKKPMEEMVGNFYGFPRWPGMKLFVVYHTAYILRDPRKKPLMEQHLRTLKSHLTAYPL